MTKAAVIIGVDKTGKLPTLSDAAAGAIRVAKWLKEEELYDVKLHVDSDRKEVLVSDIANSIRYFVEEGVTEQLVVYFTGHGCMKDYSEYWLLSRAPDDANEAVCLAECVELARDCGIPNVIFISDACRSTPHSLRADRVRGTVIFPNNSPTIRRAEVDRLFACLPGDPAFEVPVDDSAPRHQTLFTSCLCAAYVNTPATHTDIVDGSEVLSNRKLKKLLPTLIERAAPRLSQRPDCIVESSDQIFIAKVTRDHDHEDVAEDYSWRDVANFVVSDALNISLRRGSVGRGQLTHGSLSSHPVSDAIEHALDASHDTEPEGESAIEVRGTRLRTAIGLGFKVNFKNTRESSSVSVEPDYEGVVFIRFEDGGGAAIPVLKKYTCSVVVEDVIQGQPEKGIMQVNYIPLKGSEPHRFNELEKAEKMRATVAGLARNGLFWIDNDIALPFWKYIWQSRNSVDPTLSLYSSYAYNDRGQVEQIQSIKRGLFEALDGKEFFDIALLISALQPNILNEIVPFCPMLSRGWQLLRAKRVVLPEAIERAGEHRRQSLWTTFDERGSDIVEAFIRRG